MRDKHIYRPMMAVVLFALSSSAFSQTVHRMTNVIPDDQRGAYQKCMVTCQNEAINARHSYYAKNKGSWRSSSHDHASTYPLMQSSEAQCMTKCSHQAEAKAAAAEYVAVHHYRKNHADTQSTDSSNASTTYTVTPVN
mgnify:FL=1